MFLTRRLAALTAAAFLSFGAGCGSDSGPTSPTATPVLGVTATAISSSSIKVSFNSRAGDNSYNIERAEGASGAFAALTTVQAPATPAPVAYTDANLKANTQYRYRVITVVGSAVSPASSEASANTLSVGAFTADLTQDITASRRLSRDTTYTLKGFIHVLNGATLTIDAGTKIVGDFNTLGSSLFIMRGARIDAQGTAELPIVFTSSRPVGQRQPGDWGGLIIIGNAPINRTGVSVEVEGTGTNTPVESGKNYQVLYSGGTTLSDNSGTLSYVRVEFAGFAPATGFELNSFTFAAVGSGTRISYLQSLAGLDDAFEFFGGALDGDHLVAYETGDDMFDMSEGFSGRLQFLIGFNSVQLTPRTGAGAIATDLEGIENDGCNGSGCTNGFNTTPYTLPLVANFTLVGCGSQACFGPAGGFGMMLRRGTGGYYVNGVLSRFTAGGVSVRDPETFLRANNAATPDVAASDLQIRNVLFSEVSNQAFQANTATPANQFALDLAGNALTSSTAVATGLFTSLPAAGALPANLAALDWTPSAASPIATGGMATFSGRIAAKAGSFVTATAYQGAAAPGGAKWWAGWTNYARN